MKSFDQPRHFLYTACSEKPVLLKYLIWQDFMLPRGLVRDMNSEAPSFHCWYDVGSEGVSDHDELFGFDPVA